MYKITFAVGVILIGAAFVSAYATGGSIVTVLFGSAGTLNLVAFFLKDPPLNLQQNRAELAKLKAAYYGWFLDVENWVQANLRSFRRWQIILETRRYENSVRNDGCKHPEVHGGFPDGSRSSAA